jgi:purine-cytosine permease-like protein
LGATISRATDSGNFALLLGSTIVMAMIVVTVNRLVWRRMYRLAADRYTLQRSRFSQEGQKIGETRLTGVPCAP